MFAYQKTKDEKYMLATEKNKLWRDKRWASASGWNIAAIVKVLHSLPPYYSALLLESYDVNAEYTVADRVSYYRFTFSENPESHIPPSMSKPK